MLECADEELAGGRQVPLLGDQNIDDLPELVEIEDLAVDQLERFPLLGCYRVADLQAAGFEIWPTFWTPHVTIAFSGDPDEHLAALVRAAHDVRINPYHETDDGPER